MDHDPDDEARSAICVANPLHARVGSGSGGPHVAADPVAWADVARWRKAERERLIAARLAIPADARAAMARDDRRTARRDRSAMSPAAPSASTGRFAANPTFGPGWPRVIARGGTTALPVVVEKAHPLIFRAYRPGDRLEKGVWNIPVPAEGEPVFPTS